MKLLLIDNYDSFTYNIYQYLRELNHEVQVFRNDKITIDNIREISPDAIFLSPGPKTPSEAGICIDTIKEFAGKISIFGVCLGHQAIGEAFGGVITHAKTLMHGKTSSIKPFAKGVMKEFDTEFIATRYHSLVIQRETLPDCLEITCETEDGEIMGVVHKQYNIEGVQFHPESILTTEGKKIFISFLKRTQALLQNCEHKKAGNLMAASFLKSNLKEFTPESFINIQQQAQIIEINQSAYQLFQKITSHFGTDQCFLLESAYGPKIDCTRTIIGVFPCFELRLDNKQLAVKSQDATQHNVLHRIFRNVYPEKDGGFDIGTDKFSNVFNILTKSIHLEKEHDLDITVNNGLIGYFGYEYLHYIESVPRKTHNALGLPDVHLKYYQILIEIEHDDNKMIFIENKIFGKKINAADELVSVIQGNPRALQPKAKRQTIPLNMDPMDQPSTIQSNITKEKYFELVAKAKHYIYEGDIFQVQLGQRLTLDGFNIEAIDLYDKLRQINPSPYMFFWDSKDYQLIGDSPELQLRIENDEVMIRPIAGTSKGKGHDEASRREIINKFQNDAKENAEHIMLVDLARNDIGTMAIPGTVCVKQLMSVEEFSHVFHLTSTVVGNLYKGLNSMEIFEATFPAGTLTGAPKVRAMEIISELEPEIRGPYGGAFGFFDFNGNIVSSIIIRTALKIGSKIFLQASAGIVADSIAENEWQETEFKMKALRVAVEELNSVVRRSNYAINE